MVSPVIYNWQTLSNRESNKFRLNFGQIQLQSNDHNFLHFIAEPK